MDGITIQYDYSGDEAKWEKITSSFIAAIDSDKEISGRLHYRIHRAKQGNRRIHWGWWDRPETVAILQSRDYFKVFAASVRDMGGETLSTQGVTCHTMTMA